MRRIFNRLITTALFIAVAATSVVAQISFTVNTGTTREYHIDKQADIANYNWAVYTNVNLTIPASPANVSLTALGAGRENEIQVRWNTPGTYFLNVTTTGTDGCDNNMAFGFEVINNDEFTANPDNYRLYIGQTGIFNVIENDYSPNNNINPASLLIVNDPKNGNVISNGDGNVTYVPLPNFEGLDSFQYRICDAGTPPTCDEAWVFVTVHENICIVAHYDTASTFVNEAVNIAVLDNDFDYEGVIDSTYTIEKEPVNGTLKIETDFTITYTPNHLFAGIDSFIYKVYDLGYPPCSDTAMVYITVIDNNQPIVVLPDVANVTVNNAINIDVLANDNDPDGEINISSLSIVTLPSNGTVSIVNGRIVYTPNTDFIGSDTFVYSVCDNGPIITCGSAQVEISVNEKANEAPIAVNDTFNAWSLLDNTYDITSNDFDTDGVLDLTSLTIVDKPLKGTLTVDPISGLIVYTPDHCQFGTDSLHYVIYDDKGLASNIATVYFNIEIHPLTDSDGDGIPDIVEDLNGNGNPCDDDTDGDGIPNYLDIDDDGDGMSTADEIAENGPDFDLDGDGIPNYLDPDDNGDGIPSIDQMHDFDNSGKLDRDEIWNSKAITDYISIGFEQMGELDVLLNDSTQMDPTTLSVVIDPKHGYTSIDQNGWNINYYPDLDFIGTDSLVYMVCDYYNRCDTAFVYIYVEDIVFPPELFTPNNDGQNDRYIIRGLDNYPDNNFVVFNRWGNKVYELKGYYDQWDGTSNIKMTIGNKTLPVGVYYYIVKYGKNKEKDGALFLER